MNTSDFCRLQWHSQTYLILRKCWRDCKYVGIPYNFVFCAKWKLQKVFEHKQEVRIYSTVIRAFQTYKLKLHEKMLINVFYWQGTLKGELLLFHKFLSFHSFLFFSFLFFSIHFFSFFSYFSFFLSSKLLMGWDCYKMFEYLHKKHQFLKPKHFFYSFAL